MRRWFLPVLILAITAFGAWQLFQRLEGGRALADPWWAMPADAAVIIEVPRPLATWDEAAHGSVIFNALVEGTDLAAVDSLMRRLAQLRGGTSEGPLLIALMRLGAGRVATAMAFPAPTGEEAGTLLAAWGIAEHDMRRALDGVAISLPKRGANPWQLALAEGLVLLCDDPGVLGTMVGQARKQEGPAWDAGLLAARATWGAGVDAHVVMRTDPAWRMLGAWTIASFIDRDPWPDGWVALDLRVRSDAILLSGVLMPDNGTDTTTERAAHDPLMVLRHLPLSTALFDLHDPAELRASLDPVVPADLHPHLLDPLVGPVVSLAGTREDGGVWHALIALEVDSSQLVEALLPLVAEGDRPEDHRGIPLWRIPALARLVVGGVEPSDPWCAWQEGRLVIGDGADGVRTVLDGWIDGVSLASDARATTLIQRLATRAPRTFWWDPRQGRPVIEPSLAPSGRELIARHTPLLDQLGGVLFQTRAGGDGRRYLSAGLLLAPAMGSTDPALWRIRLNAPLARQPDVVRNHVNGMQELLVQDTTHRIALISAAGQVLWERPLDGPIIGAVRQVDRFKNRKLQLLVCTARKLYLIDRNGKDVEGFPVALPAEAATALSVFDYERDGNYRVLLPLADGRILNLMPDGKPVQGFDPPAGMGRATFPVHHLRIKGRDHLVVSCADGRVHVLDRKGQVRHKPRLELEPEARPLLWVPGAELGSTQLLWMAADGAVNKASLDGDAVLLGRGVPDHVVRVGRSEREALLLPNADTLTMLRSDGIQWSAVMPGTIMAAADAGSQPGTMLLQWLDGQGVVHVLNEAGAGLWQEREPAAVPGILADLNGDGETEWIQATRAGELVALRRASHARSTGAPNP